VSSPENPPGGTPYSAPHLASNAANFMALTPLNFLARASTVYPDKLAVVHGATRFTYRQFYERCCRLADALRRRGIRPRDTVAVMAPNIPPLLEAHYGVPMSGAVLNALNYHLDARSIAFILAHGEAKLLIADREFAPIVAAALEKLEAPIPVVEIDEGVGGASLGETDYEAFLCEGDPAASWHRPRDEWEPIALNYTSGTTGNPKGVVYHHRGAFLNAMSNAIIFGLDRTSVYLWTLPMFHCNGWTFTWAVTAIAGTHVCLRRVDPASIFPAIAEHGVTHMCGAPIVLNLLVHAPEQIKRGSDHIVEIATGGAAPPAAIIEGMERIGFRVTHLYGLTESYGPSTVCAWQDSWTDLPLPDRAARMARQGVVNLVLTGHKIVDPQTMTDVPADGSTLGELVLRGSTLMRGYFKNPAATEAAFEGGWFHTGDLAVQHPDGYIEIKDRSKDIIIVGGDNLSSLEVEDTLYRHPQVLEAAVVAKPDPVWGEVPCAFITLKPDAGAVSAEDITAWCRDNLALYKVPQMVVFAPLPKTSTGKVQKFELRERAKKITTQTYHQIAPDRIIVEDVLERDIQNICEKVLGISPLKYSDNILEYGADSLKVLILFLEIAAQVKRDLRIGDLFATPTVEGMASVIRRASAGTDANEPSSEATRDIRQGKSAAGDHRLNGVVPTAREASPAHPIIARLNEETRAALLKLMPFVWSQWDGDFIREMFQWRYLDRPSDCGTWLAFDNDECVALIDSFVRPYILDSRRVLVREPADWFSLPQYRPFGVGLTLIRAMMECSEPIIAIGGTDATRSLLPRLGWKSLPAVYDMTLPVTFRGFVHKVLRNRAPRYAERARAIPRAIPARWPPKSTPFFSDACIEEWQPGQRLSIPVPQEGGLIALLQPADLEWMYKAPRRLLRPMVLTFWVGGESVGLSLSQLEPSAYGANGRIVHLQVSRPTEEIVEWVVCETARRLAEMGAELIRCRASHQSIVMVLRKTGFTTGSEPAFWWAKDGSPPPSSLDIGYLRGDDTIPFGAAPTLSPP
jgi:fatty-acyl-CoA synthase